MRKLLLLLFAFFVITGCKKEEIITVTKSSGRVIERSTNAPLAGIKVAVSNGQRDLVTTTTDSEGRFEFTVDFDKVTETDSLSLDGRPNLPSKKYEMKGMGKAEYDYGTLWLYDKSDAIYLPRVTTDSIVSVDTTSAVIAGTVRSDGGFAVTKRGVCYAPHQWPDFTDNVKASGTGMGAFVCEISDLTPATEYCCRSFAINAIDTVFGEQKTFKTPAKTYSVHVSASPGNGGSVTGGGTFEEGSIRTVVATANVGYTFVNWTENGSEVSTDASYSFTLAGNRTLVAHFQVKTYTVTTSSSPADGGSTTGDGTYSHGQSCTLRAVPASGYTFLRWIKSGTQVSTEPNYTFEVTESGNYVASFTDQPQAFTVSVSASPSNGGVVTGGGTFGLGQTCTVRATAHSGYVFTNWTESGTVVSEQSNYTFTVAGNRTLVANFTASQNAYTINVSANPTNGGVTSGGGNYQQGQQCTVVATANGGFNFTNWTENGNVVSSDARYTFAVNGSRTLVANFASETYTIGVSASPSDGGGTSGGGTYNYGQSCTVTATAASGYSFVNWTEGGNVVSTNADYTFIVTSNRVLVANFSFIEGEWLHYDDGTYLTSVAGASSMLYWSSMFPAESIAQYAGATLTKVALYENDFNNSEIIVSIYFGGTAGPGSLVSTMNYSPIGGNAFHEVVLNTPVTIDGTQNLWIVFSANTYGTYPASVCADTGEANNRWVSLDGSTWGDLAGAMPGYSWMIRGYVSFGRSNGSTLELKSVENKIHTIINQDNQVRKIKIN